MTSENPINQTNQNYQLEFFGKGSEYFSIMIVNWLLTLVTLGIYYPWARAKKLQYIYGQTALNEERFHFSGTGKEMFRGFIKIFIFYIAVISIFLLLMKMVSTLAGILFFYLAILSIIPFAIHGAFRYRLSRTTYRGIRFGYRGDRYLFVGYFFRWLLFTVLTFGIYGAWMAMNIRRYTHSNIRYGDVAFSNDGDGGEFLVLNLKGYILSLLTLGIYIFWWQRDLFNYYINRMRMIKGEPKIQCYSTATGRAFFNLMVGNLLLVIFTLGLGTAWAEMRTLRFIWNNIKMEGNINLEEVYQTEDEYNDAFGEDLLDFFEIDIA